MTNKTDRPLESGSRMSRPQAELMSPRGRCFCSGGSGQHLEWVSKMAVHLKGRCTLEHSLTKQTNKYHAKIKSENLGRVYEWYVDDMLGLNSLNAKQTINMNEKVQKVLFFAGHYSFKTIQNK